MPCDNCTPVAAARDAPEGDPKRHFQVVLFGGARVGKTSMISQFLYDKVITFYILSKLKFVINTFISYEILKVVCLDK